jgi:hypothetical protein
MILLKGVPYEDEIEAANKKRSDNKWDECPHDSKRDTDKTKSESVRTEEPVAFNIGSSIMELKI